MKATLSLTRPSQVTLSVAGSKPAHLTLVSVSKSKTLDLTKSTKINYAA